jgi:DnaJ-class molecular chaperone
MEVTLRQKPHPRFTRRGADLVCAHELSLLEALAGFRTTLRHLDGNPLCLSCEGEVTRPGQLRRVRGWGMPRPRSGGKGDLYLRFSVRFPKEPLSDEACSLLRKLLPAVATAGGATARPEGRTYRLEAVGGRETDEEQEDDWEGLGSGSWR